MDHKLRETLTEEHAEREGPTVMNITTPLLEMPPEVRQNVDRARSETVSKLWMATEKMNILYPENWTRKAAEEILWFQGLKNPLLLPFQKYFHLTLWLIRSSCIILTLSLTNSAHADIILLE